MRASFRVAQAPSAANNTTGFRCARPFFASDVVSCGATLDLCQLSETNTASPSGPIVIARVGANLRSGPGGNYPRIGSVRTGEELPVRARANSANGLWYLVLDLDGQLKWISATVVELAPAGIEVEAAATIPPPP